MALSRRFRVRNRILVTIAACAFGLAAIVYLSLNVVQDLKLLNTARSDNVQWTLSQAEVEFLEFDVALFDAQLDTGADLNDMRREFDIFYSRINTLEQSSIYAPLKDIPEFADSLAAVRAFLDATVPAIDGSDADLRAELPQLQQEAEVIRPKVRRLSNSSLDFFATESDARRTDISVTLIQLAGGIAALMIALLLLALYLGVLNAQNVRRRAQVIEASERMNVVTGTSLDGVIISDETGKILDFNTAAEQIFGVSASDALGRDLVDIVVPDHHVAAHNAGMERMRQSGERRVVGKGRVKLDAKRADGEIFPVELAIQSAETRDGEIFIAFLRDISHRVKAEEDLVEARDRALAGEKAKTDFLATMSHEIRTPLNGLLGNLTLLQDTRLNPKQSRYIRNMETSGKLLMNHISDVLDITKYDAGKLRLLPVDMNLSELLQDIVDNQGGAAAANRTTLEWGWVGERADWIHADRDRIQHVLMNLVGNAVKFTRDGKVSVTLGLRRDAQNALEIIVRDTGVGIAPELRERVFDDFVTGDSSYDREVGGTGLGLGLAKRFVAALGGTIELQSTPGQGSAFTVQFPVKPIEAPKRNASEDTVWKAERSCHVLLVEDNEINREVASEMIRRAGHAVTEAHDGQEAVELARDRRFDLILMDISMPLMDGRTATRTIRSGNGVSATTPIIAVTANAMLEEQEAFVSDGMQEILTKPLSRDALLTVLSRYCVAGHTTQPVQNSVSQDHVQSLVDTLGAEGARSIINRFSAEVSNTLTHFETWETRPLEETAERAHKVAGSAATLGARALREGLIAVEVAAQRNDSEGVAESLATLPAIWVETECRLAFLVS